ncbi:hypothetical protein [Bradyrhizobium sp.]|uniref:hypothetical protein n=1 Tax=Bradyrhizobium sp. TaxID=376 RepID=UPI003BAEB14F
MADDTIASVIPLHQLPLKKRDKKGVERARTYRQRKRKAKAAASNEDESPSSSSLISSEFLIPPEFFPANDVVAGPPVTPLPPKTPRPNDAVMASRSHLAPILLSIAALALAVVGITINGWFARSLGASDVAGWLFLAVGVAADLVALVMPSCAAGLWGAGQRATALVGWAVWIVTFIFAVTAGIGFASTNISDVTTARASRVTPAVTNAQAALADAMTARDRECKGGVGKFCREREATVVERRQILDSAMASVGQTADPQSDAAIKLVTWASRGTLRPTPDDFAMLRLVLLALLPQIGGILIMVGRHSALRRPLFAHR